MSTNKTGTNNGAQAKSGIRAVLTPEEIDTVVRDLMAPDRAALEASVPNFKDVWFAKAIDPRGEERAYGLGHTAAEARVKAWITFWDAQHDFSAVPRFVPEGWTFEVYPPREWEELFIWEDELPTPSEIDTVIFDMIAAEAAQVPDDTSLDELWSAEAIDPRGETQGYGLGHTPAEARAGAWINTWWPECDLRAVPRSVPEGWMFGIYPPGEGPVFRRTTVGLP